MPAFHLCSCGQFFELKVLLVVHCQDLGHRAAACPASTPSRVPAVKSFPLRMAAAGLLFASFLGANLASTAVTRYTEWKSAPPAWVSAAYESLPPSHP